MPRRSCSDSLGRLVYPGSSDRRPNAVKIDGDQLTAKRRYGRPIDAAKTTVSSFGDDVRRIVDGCTDADEDPKPPWFERKQAYLARLATEDRAILLVSASDKLHHARSIVRDLRAHGDHLWSRFSAPRECTVWYYRSLVTAYQHNPDHTLALVDELDRTVSEMEALAGLHQETEVRRAAIGSGEACRTWSQSVAEGQV